ncbi:efflux RND transporter permease subunit [Natrarchaeobaculum aegyptiacum]|uniref:Patched family protein n=1 Tax=Natrarchaeobaculum aegyptiacum TaxID=745377 RepID=A0A2Z2HUP1_9EURY|nr:MMPL family transporter [Natrarchaeobaculum aegyptiacum]ARS90900.1 Patched family protein [Natrarchaeobaculum aegyptiacum]
MTDSDRRGRDEGGDAADTGDPDRREPPRGSPVAGHPTEDAHAEDPFTRRINPVITGRPWTVVLVFLVLTGLFLGGALVGGGEQEAGADQFTDDSPEQEAWDEIQENFERGDRASGGTTAQLVVEDDRNVLSRQSMLRMLEFQDRVETTDRLRVTSTTSPASLVAQELNENATTAERQHREVERASQRHLEEAIADADESAGLPVSTDFNREAASASVAQIAITYDTPPSAGDDTHASLQYETAAIADEIDGFDTSDNVVLFGDAILNQERFQLLGDTAIVVFPAALLLILFFLLVAYRDPLDLGLGLAALMMTLIWTFGFMGIANIPFSDALITVFPLLLAVGIDFGIHIINRYREERAAGADIGDAMGITTRQLTTAFLIVTLTTVFSFAANLVSSMEGLRHFGIVAAFGMIFTFLIFGVFLPAGKVGLDRLREGTRVPSFGTTPLGSEESVMGQVLPAGVKIAQLAPVVFLVAILVGSLGAAAYGTGVDTEFDQEAFFPDQDRIDQYQYLPGPFAPSEYTFITYLEYLEEDFDQGFQSTVTIYVEDRDLRSDRGLTAIDRSLENPDDAFVSENRRADADTILDVIDEQAEADPEFASTIDRYDSSGDGVPDREVDYVYDELFDSPASDQAAGKLATDRSATRIDVTVDVDAEQDEAVLAAEEYADRMALDATATGQLVIFEAVIDDTLESSVNSLLVAFVLTTIFLVLSYWWLEGRAVYGVINVVPVLVTVALLAGSMRYFDVPLTPINAPILSVSIGLGVDYTVHFIHRFVDEFEAGNSVDEALLVTVRGTGGALTGSMLTTVTGLGVLYLALIPLIMEFGLLLALGVFYAWLTSLLVVPSTIVVWDRLENRYRNRLRYRARD